MTALFLSVWILSRTNSAQPVPSRGCGPASLSAACERLGIPINRAELLPFFGNRVEQCDFQDLKEAAVKAGLEAQGMEMSVSTLRRSKPVGIIHVDSDHFVALRECDREGVHVANPINAESWSREYWTYARLSERWRGRILVLSRKRLSSDVRQLRGKVTRGGAIGD